jgi:hypothetical protein
MCLSAPVSFAASAVLTATGGAIVNEKPLKSEILIAVIPFLFAAQQAIEGVQWMLIKQGEPSLLLGYVFLFFAFLLWPVYIPVAVYMIERDKWRKIILRWLVVAGFVVAAWLLFFTLSSSLDIQVYNRSIMYSLPYSPYITELYALVIAGSLLLTSHKIIRWFGYTIVAAFLVSYFFFIVTITSTWCFFAALLSFILYFHFYKRPETKN